MTARLKWVLAYLHRNKKKSVLSTAKKHKTPFLLRAIRLMFPVLETVAPFLAVRLFVKLFFTPFKYPVPEKERNVAAQAEKFTVHISGHKKIQCYSWGRGPTVLFIHGWAGRATQFRNFFEPLNTAGYKAIAFDGPAHGLSDGKQTDLMEFHEAVLAIQEKVGPVHVIVAHSFGGSVSLYSVMKGLPVSILINIASPTIGDEILRTYLRATGASWKTAESFKIFVQKKTGKPFDEFTPVYFIRHVPASLHLLLIHDTEDRDAPVYQSIELQRNHSWIQLQITDGLGHTRILKDQAVVEKAVTFIKENSSGKL